MKKVMMSLVALMALSGFTFAQSYTQGTGIMGRDKLGAHQNGGRGCTGCHAPHSGGRGGGGNAASGAGPISDPYSGNYALWGEDVTPLLGYTIKTGDTGSFADTLPGTVGGGANSTNYVTQNETETSGLMFCLSCHDGNVAKGGMMTNALYEQRIGVLPTGLYGPNTIPTLLGNDGSSAGNYQNDHPVGIAANLGAVNSLFNSSFTLSGTTLTYVKGATTGYDTFISNYGTMVGSVSGGRAAFAVPSGATQAGQAYLVCTSCHTPHTMFIASGTWGSVKGSYPTYFFLNAPYNPGSIPIAGQDGTKASSATQFCRQCHYSGAGGSNESVGITTVTTAF